MINTDEQVPEASLEQPFSEEYLDGLMARVAAGELSLTGPGGFISAMIKSVLERGLRAELAEHLGYDKGDPAGAGTGNSRWGHLPPGAAGKGEAPPARP